MTDDDVRVLQVSEASRATAVLASGEVHVIGSHLVADCAFDYRVIVYSRDLVLVRDVGLGIVSVQVLL